MLKIKFLLTEINVYSDGYKRLNNLELKFFDSAEKRGYDLISYVSSKAFIWRNVEIGKNCFIFEDNTVQPYVKIGKM